MENVFHKIKVNLYENFLTDNPDDFSAKVISERTLNVKEICKTAINRGGAPSTAEAMEHNVMLFLKEMAYQLMDGYAVNTGYFIANAQVRGVFGSRSDAFDPNRHSILFRFNQGELMRREIPNIQVQVMGLGDSSIMLSHVVDSKTGSVNDLITTGGTLKIKGGKLKIAGDNPAIGVSFENETGDKTRIETNDLIVNSPSTLIVQIPALAPGKYRLAVCTQYTTGGNMLKEPKTSSFDKILTVV